MSTGATPFYDTTTYAFDIATDVSLYIIINIVNCLENKGNPYINL